MLNGCKGIITTRIAMKRKVSSPSFFEAHPVFSLGQAARALGQSGERERVRGRLKHHLKTGRLKTVARGAYVVVPYGSDPKQVKADPFQVAATLRPDAVFSHHSALELLGVAQSLWRQCTLYTSAVRRPLALADRRVLFLAHPTPLRRRHQLATQQVERAGALLRVTGPERTLVEGFRRPALVGGLEELVQSASGFPVLDLEVLETTLRAYDAANLWAATGWFLERYQSTFHVPDSVLALCERHRPRSPQYLARGTRGGVLASRWNLILPEVLVARAGAGEA